MALILKYNTMKNIITFIPIIFSLSVFGQNDTVVIIEMPDTTVLEETVIQAYRATHGMPVTFKNLSKTDSKFQIYVKYAMRSF